MYWYNRNWDEQICPLYIERCSLFGVFFIGSPTVAIHTESYTQQYSSTTQLVLVHIILTTSPLWLQ